MVFTARPNIVTKELEWVVREEDYEYEDEIAASGYGDMLFDAERNEKYRAAIRSAIQRHGASSSVLDIGTGTGLLALMSAEAGAEYVTACEGFAPMARVAREAVAKSTYSDRITVIAKRSDELEVGEDYDLKKRADIVVHEILDTELLGEGVLPSLRDAYARLLKADAISIPEGATLFAQVIESRALWDQHKPPTLPQCKRVGDCQGQPQALSVQADFLQEITPLTEPFEVFDFDFSGPPSSEGRKSTVSVKGIGTGSAHAVLCWWTLRLNADITLSTAPKWIAGHDSEWRDHWMQAIYFLPQEVAVIKDAAIELTAAHDDYSVWFKLDSKHAVQLEQLDGSRCICGMHLLWNNSRLAAMNNSGRMAKLKQGVQSALKDAVALRKDVVCVSVSDGSLPALFAADENVMPVYSGIVGLKRVDPLLVSSKNSGTGAAVQRPVCILYSSNGVKFIKSAPRDMTEADIGGQRIGVLLGEPHFNSSLLPWHKAMLDRPGKCTSAYETCMIMVTANPSHQNLYFWYARTSLSHLLEPNCVIMPACGKLMVLPVELKDLWKSHAPIGEVCGFDLSAFQKLADKGSGRHGGIFPYTMSEYLYQALTEPVALLTFDFKDTVIDLENTITVCPVKAGKLNGLIMWMDYELMEDLTLSNSPTDSPYAKQAVFMLHFANPLAESDCLSLGATFHAQSGEIAFTFKKNEVSIT